MPAIAQSKERESVRKERSSNPQSEATVGLRDGVLSAVDPLDGTAIAPEVSLEVQVTTAVHSMCSPFQAARANSWEIAALKSPKYPSRRLASGSELEHKVVVGAS